MGEPISRSEMRMRALAQLERAKDERYRIAQEEAEREMRLANDEADELERDRARLDWLGDLEKDTSALYVHGGQWCFNGAHYATFREAIDAAMQSDSAPRAPHEGEGGE